MATARMGEGRAADLVRLLPWALLGLSLTASVVVMLAGGWTPLGDDAMIASYVLDVPGDLPLNGMPTSLGLRSGTPVHHPGPLPFWLLAPTTHAFGAPGRGLGLGVLLIHLGSLALTALFALRMRVRAAAWVVAACLGVLLTNTLDAGRAVEPFNPHLTVVAGFGAATCLWAFVAGDDWALPAFTFLGSVAAQAHVTMLPLVGVLALVAVAATVVELRRRPREGERRRRLAARAVPVALLVGVASWSGPIADLVAGDRNLLLLAAGGGDVDGIGWSVAFDRLVTAVGLPPGWTGDQVSGVLPPASAARRLGGVAVLAALALLTAWAWRARQRTVAAGGAVALVLAAAATVAASRIPADERAQMSPLNRLFWWPVGAVVWSALLLAGIALAAELAGRSRDERRARAAGAALAVASLAVVAASGAVVVRSTEPAHAANAVAFGAVRQHAAAIEAELDGPSVVRLTAGDLSIENLYFVNGLVAQLRFGGHTVQVDVPDWWGQYVHYQRVHPADDPPDLVVFVRGSPRAPAAPPGAVPLSAYDPDRAAPGFEGYDGPIMLAAGRGTSWVYRVQPSSDGSP